MANLLDLKKRMADKVKQVRTLGNEAKKHVAIAIADYLIEQTPVDTSQALSNWQPKLGFPATFPISAYFRGAGGSTRAASIAKAKQEARDVIALSQPGEPVYLSNVLAYIDLLNRGSSTQHPGQFVEASLIVGRVSLADFNYRL